MPTIVAADAVLNPTNPTEGYVLDAMGGVHPFGGAADPGALPINPPAYWSNAGPARKLIVIDWAKPAGYVLDCLGALHAFGGAVNITDNPYWKGGFIPPVPQT